MKFVFSTLFVSALLCCTSRLFAQCNAGELQVTVTVHTDGYGYEAYWQLIPAANNCGTGTIFAGGNLTMNCSSGGDRQQVDQGYGDFQSIAEGPWCLTEGDDYSIFSIDDWGDGGTSFEVNISGYPVQEFKTLTTDQRFTFTVQNPPAIDVTLTEITTSAYIAFGEITIEGQLKNTGTTNITSVDISYSIDNGTPVTGTLSGINVAPFTTYYFEHPTQLDVTTAGDITLFVQLANVNGQGQDANAANDTLSKALTVRAPIPNIMHWYTEPGNNMQFDTIATTNQDLNIPRDLDFAPNGNLWIINKDSEPTGGSTVTIENPGKTNQASEHKRDGNARHFMSLPTGIAFSNNGNFATSNGVFDANFDGGTPFTGPSLWSSDPAIYAQPSGGNGSHLDMLHETPNGMGIASESENKFWIFDAHSDDIVSYDFNADHGPGNDDHSDGEIRRYKGMTVDRINDHIVCHLAYDLNSGWLYIVDGANQRILRLNTKTGSPGGTPSFAATEPLAEYVDIVGATWETVADTGLIQPAGIDLIGNHLIVSDYFNGDLIIYDITSLPATEVTRIQTGAAGVMGLVVGPDGRIWYTNADNNIIVRIEPDSVPVIDPTGVYDIDNDLSVTLYPVPATDEINVVCNECGEGNYQLTVYDVTGTEVFSNRFSGKRMSINSSRWSPGVYTAMVRGDKGRYLRKIVVE